jgi:hypothetical protein
LLEKLAQAAGSRAEIAAEALLEGSHRLPLSRRQSRGRSFYRGRVERFPRSPCAVKAWPYLGWEHGRAKLGI